MLKITVSQSIHQALKELLTDNPNLILIYDNLSDHNSLIQRFGKNRIIKNELEGGCITFAFGAKFFNLSVILEIYDLSCITKKDLSICHLQKKFYIGGSVIIRLNFKENISLKYFFRTDIIILAPFSCKDHLGLLKKASLINKPVFILENENLYIQKFDYFPTFNYAYTQDFHPIYLKEGCDVTFISYSEDINRCIYISNNLESSLSNGILNLICLKPINEQVLINQAYKYKLIIIISRIDEVTRIIKKVYKKFRDKVFYLDYESEKEIMLERVLEIIDKEI